jgi:nucleotide-binding universal stress UspA family protein
VLSHLVGDDGGVTNPETPSENDIAQEHRFIPGSPVIVGIDSSPEAQRGLVFAADLAENLGVELFVVHAFGLVGNFGDWRSGVEAREREVRAALADEWCAPLHDRDELRWQSRCVQGSAVVGILRAAEEIDAGFIVVGSHGAGSSASELLGSTSHDIVRHSRRPVVVVPPTDAHRHRRIGSSAVGPTEP